MEDKRGRSRSYEWANTDGPGIRWYVSALEELHERVFDQIEDLSEEELSFVAPESQISMGWLVTHLISSDVNWIERLSGQSRPAWLSKGPLSQLRRYGEVQPSFGSPDSLIDEGRRAWTEWGKQILLGGVSPSDETGAGPLPTAGAVLSHLIWHWSFHSGHIGLVRLQAGGEYEWTF